MRFVCDSCRAQYMISDDKVGAKGVKVRCKKCGYVILVRRADSTGAALPSAAEATPGADASAGSAEASGSGDSEGEALGAAAEGALEPPPPEQPAGGQPGAPLSGIEDDEIGAVFDQVLKSGPHKLDEPKPSINSLTPPPENEDLNLGLDDDLASTRVVSTDALKKLAMEAEARAGGLEGAAAPAPKRNGATQHNDWYVAINDQQTGPLTVEKVKAYWDGGEIGPDSLCWRAGMPDWMPLSDVEELASQLAPKPQRPVVAAPATSQVGTVVNVPVETPVSFDGGSRTVRGDAPVASGSPGMAAAPQAAEGGGWKPSAASALAALVSEEMSALSTKPKARSLLETGPGDAPAARATAAAPSGGLFDIPSAPGDIPAQNGKGLFPGGPEAPAADPLVPAAPPAMDALARPPGQPYAGPAVYGAPAYPAYAPPPPPAGMSSTLKIGLGVAATLVLVLGAVVVYLVTRPPAAPAPAQVAAAAVPATQPADVPMPPPPSGLQPRAAEPEKKPEPAVAAKPEPTPAKPAPVAERPPPTPAPAVARRRDTGDSDAIVASRRGSAERPSGGSDDEFDKLFGGSGAPAKREQPAARTRPSAGYIPPPPGGATKERLGDSDITEVVLRHKSDIVDCVNQQKAKDPSLSGTVVVRWTIQTSGRTTGVSVRTAEFKSTQMASCMIGLIKSWRFPAHRVQRAPIDFPFRF